MMRPTKALIPLKIGLMLLLLFTVNLPAAVAVPGISIPSGISVVAGGQVEIPIRMTHIDDAEGFSGFNFRLDYDDAIFSNPTPVVEGTYCEALTPEDILAVVSPEGGGKYSIAVMLGLSASEDGTIIKIRFDVDAGFIEGTTDMAFVAPNTSKCHINAFFILIPSDFAGTSIAVDTCPDDPAKIAPGACGCGVPDTDSDGDGTADCNDGCPDDPAKIAPGQCGCGVPDTDCDADGISDCNDQDDDNDGMSDEFENRYGLAVCDPDDAQQDADGDGFTNLEECKAGSSPLDNTDFPSRPQVVEASPHDGQGIDAGTLRVPHDTSVVVRVKDDTGIDEDSVQMDLAVNGTPGATIAGTLVKKRVSADDASAYWFIFYPEGALEFGTEIAVTLTAMDQDGIAMNEYQYRFGVETELAHDAAEDNTPAYERDTTDPDAHQVTACAATGIEGAMIVYDADEPVIPRFGPIDEIPLLDVATGFGLPVCLAPPTVFNEPVTLTIPCPGADSASALAVYYYNPEAGWVPACDAEGNVLSDGDGWMVPGSRVDHNETVPKTIEIQVTHSGVAQAGAEDPASRSKGGGCFLSTLVD